MANSGLRESRVQGLHVVEEGPEDGPPVLFLHGWPQSWRAWHEVMPLAAEDGHRAIAIDLPGIGGSAGAARGGAKHEVAAVVHELVEAMDLHDLALVGMDAGGMVAHAYAREHPLRKVVIADTVVPGLDPWEEVLANPYVWHFAFHGIPGLPETVVTGREREWFDYFWDAVSADPSKITEEARQAYVEAYREPGALTAGFDWYRAFRPDAERNQAHVVVETPLLYLRGENEGGDIERYRRGFEAVGWRSVTTGRVAGAGHFAPEEAPQDLWRLLAGFLGD